MKRTYIYNKKNQFGSVTKILSESIKMNHFNLRRILYFLFFIYMGLLFNSCEKDLELAPKTQYSEATFFKTADQFKLFTNQFYPNLPNPGLDVSRVFFADLATSEHTNPVSDGSYSPEPNSGTWNKSYSISRNTTYLIEKEVPSDLIDNVAIYIGEANFFRAFAYYNLLRDFGGVPIIDKVLDLDDEDLLYGPRNTRQEVTDFILNDLDAAISVLPIESDIDGNDKGRVSKGAALSLKARIALFEGTWRKYRNMDGYGTLLDLAISTSEQVMKNGEYELFDQRDNPLIADTSYRYFFILDKNQATPDPGLTKANQKEYILVNRYDGVFRPSPKRYTGQKDPNPTRKFADMFLCRDGLPIDKSPLFQGKLTNLSEYENRDLRMMNIFVLPYVQMWESIHPFFYRDWSDPYAKGYMDVPEGGNNVDFSVHTHTGYMERKFKPEIWEPSNDAPVIRYAEVLLINAEALFEKNEMITDGQLDLTINKLRARAGVASLSNAFVSSNGLDMKSEIRRERTIELFREGQRFDDLRRWKTAEIEMPQSIEGVLWTGTQYETDPEYDGLVYPLSSDGYLLFQDASQRNFEEKHYLFPLPLRQIILNPQLEQNPGW